MPVRGPPGLDGDEDRRRSAESAPMVRGERGAWPTRPGSGPGCMGCGIGGGTGSPTGCGGGGSITGSGGLASSGSACGGGARSTITTDMVSGFSSFASLLLSRQRARIAVTEPSNARAANPLAELGPAVLASAPRQQVLEPILVHRWSLPGGSNSPTVTLSTLQTGHNQKGEASGRRNGSGHLLPLGSGPQWWRRETMSGDPVR